MRIAGPAAATGPAVRMTISMIDGEEAMDEVVEEADKGKQMVGGGRWIDGRDRLGEEGLVCSEDGLGQSEVVVKMRRRKVAGGVGRCDPVDDCIEIASVDFLGPDEI